MTRKKINLKPIIVILISIVTLAATTYFVRQWNRSHRAVVGLRRGTEAYENKQWTLAADNLGKYIAIVHDDVDAIIKYADAQINIKPIRSNNINQALNSYRRAVRLDPSNSQAVISLMETYMHMLNSPAEAEFIAQQFLNHSKEIRVRHLLAMSYYLQRKFKDAHQELTAIILDHPKEVTAYALLARLAENRPDESNETPQVIYDRAIKISPDDPLAYIVRGEYYLRQSNTEDAILDFNKAKTLSFSDTSTGLRLAKAFMNSSVNENAREVLNETESIESDNLELWHLRARLAITDNDPNEMTDVADLGCQKLSAQLPLFLPLAAELYIRSEKFENAETAIEQLKGSDDSLAKVAYLNGLMASKKNDTLKALQFWKKAVDAGLKYDLVELSIASAHAGLGDIDSAIARLKKYTSRQNYLPRADLMLAEYLATSGKFRQASEMVTRYLKRFPDNIKAKLMQTSLLTRINSQDNSNTSTVAWGGMRKRFLDPSQISKASVDELTAAIDLSIENNDLGLARKLLATLIERSPSNPDVMLAEIQLLLAEGKTKTAMSRLDKTVKMHSASLKVLRYYTALNMQLENWSACHDTLSNINLATVPPDDVRTIKMLLAQVYERSDQHNKAWSVLESHYQGNPTDIAINRWLIKLAPAANMTDRIQPMIDDIKDIEGPDGWQWKYEQARHWYNSDDFQKHYDQLIAHLLDNLTVNTSDQSSRLLLAAAYEKSGNLQLASTTYKQALAHSPDNIEIVISAVTAMNNAGEYDLAGQTIKSAKGAGVTDTRLSKLQVNNYLSRRDYSSAGSVIRKLLSEDPNDLQLSLSLAVLNIRDSNFDQAAASLKQLKTRHPDSIPVTAALVDMNIKLSDPAQAISYCDELVKRLSTPQAHTLRGRTYMRIRDFEKAADDFRTALKMDHNAIPPMILLAQTFQSMDKNQQAIRLIDKVLEMAPDNFDAHKTAALIYLSSQDSNVISRTTDQMKKALEINPNDIEMLMLKARILFAKGTKPAYTAAVKILHKAADLDPAYPQLWAILAEIEMARKQYQAALKAIDTGLEYLPGNKLLYLSKARIQADQSPSTAIETLTFLRKEYPHDIDIAVYLGYMYISANQSNMAIRLLGSLDTQRHPGDAQKIQTALAEALYAAGKTDDAIDKINLLYKNYPQSNSPLLAHIRILKSARKWDAIAEVVLQWYQNNGKNSKVSMAIIQQILDYNIVDSVDCSEVILRGIVEDDYNNVDALTSLGVLLHITGRSEQALKMYEKVLMVDPDRVVAINNMAWILCEEQSKYDQALKLTSTGLSKYPDYPDLIDTAGVARYRMGQYEQSVDDFKKCIKLRHDNESASATAHFHIARSLEKLGRFTEAKNHLNKAIEINKLNGGLSSGQLAEVNMLLSEISERY